MGREPRSPGSNRHKENLSKLYLGWGETPKWTTASPSHGYKAMLKAWGREPHGHEGWGVGLAWRMSGGSGGGSLPVPGSFEEPFAAQTEGGFGGAGAPLPGRGGPGGIWGLGDAFGPPLPSPAFAEQLLEHRVHVSRHGLEGERRVGGGRPQGQGMGCVPPNLPYPSPCASPVPLVSLHYSGDLRRGVRPPEPPAPSWGGRKGVLADRRERFGGPHSGQPPLGWGWLPRDPSPRRGGSHLSKARGAVGE